MVGYQVILYTNYNGYITQGTESHFISSELNNKTYHAHFLLLRPRLTLCYTFLVLRQTQCPNERNTIFRG